MGFTIEFQPLGVRLECANPVNALDAARQAGIPLNAVCGGEGSCGKCVIQIIPHSIGMPISEIEKTHITPEKIAQGYRLACLTKLDHSVKINIPDTSIIENQVLQIEGSESDIIAHSAIKQISLKLNAAQMDDLRSDFSRIKNALNENNLTADLDILRMIPPLLRDNNWRINLWVRNNRIIRISSDQDRYPLGLAVDVGSTKIACYLVDLKTGKTLTAKGTPNPQIAYGEDIMARLGFAMQGEEQSDRLFHMTINTINKTAEALCARINRSADEITEICLVGNTAMHHFFLNLPSGSLAVSPFIPVTTEPLNPLAGELGLTAMQGASVYAPPVTAGFIGSDHLAFLFAAGFGREDTIRLGIDIGTNTEIALQSGMRIVSVSTASGPAFEGAHIKYGMRAAPGAIEHVRIDKHGRVEIDVIGSQAPIGICGSGILDAVAQMRAAKILNERGRIRKDAPGVEISPDGMPYFLLTRSEKMITLSQKDVDQILLAKGAIRAGIDILMDYLRIAAGDIEEVVIAGAFGSYMLPEHAIGIGMLPDIAPERIKVVGNAAGTGARMMLASTHARASAEQLAERIEYLELTVYPDFPMFYARGIKA